MLKILTIGRYRLVDIHVNDFYLYHQMFRLPLRVGSMMRKFQETLWFWIIFELIQKYQFLVNFKLSISI